eukprot:CAMPEP_0170141076 /NCGR_PEP_ID=MMETSP0033_2-20121228/6770_1 /TAXON_ID=195969 /ORGANISM="Dolichomastix tenuilepis, Strain CCMP3274" /LENGTH=204 /DNA_ID=CAMNT_0010377321 /DNA_START=140 /DNA_END=750 /DNA_ORIENTATION=+
MGPTRSEARSSLATTQNGNGVSRGLKRARRAEAEEAEVAREASEAKRSARSAAPAPRRVTWESCTATYVRGSTQPPQQPQPQPQQQDEAPAASPLPAPDPSSNAALSLEHHRSWLERLADDELRKRLVWCAATLSALVAENDGLARRLRDAHMQREQLSAIFLRAKLATTTVRAPGAALANGEADAAAQKDVDDAEGPAPVAAG